MGNLDEYDVLSLKRDLIGPRLIKLLKEDRDIQVRHPGEITGLDFDPFANSQDSSPKFQVQSISLNADDGRAVVWGMDSGTHRETVEPEFRRKGKKWVFTNFHYRFHYQKGTSEVTKDNDLIHMLEANAASQKKADKAGLP